MKNSRFQFEYRKSASRLHKKVGDILRSSSLFMNYRIYQEYPVSRVNESFDNNSMHFDWVITDLHLVIECHGKQHYNKTDFSGKMTEDELLESFNELKERDAKKKQAALEAGYTYVEIPYTDEKKLTDKIIWDAYERNYNNRVFEVAQRDAASSENNRDNIASRFKQQQREKRKAYLDSDAHKQELERQRKHRKEQYQKTKERIKGNK